MICHRLPRYAVGPLLRGGVMVSQVNFKILPYTMLLDIISDLRGHCYHIKYT